MALRVAVIGSGFAGTILARILRRQGHEPVLIDRATHPRFALGESSTPLAAICLERLAQRYGLEDLGDMAAYGRWMAHMPEVRRGLKRGFTFYRHEPQQPFRNDVHNSHRLLVAASPHDGVADSHWLREDVDSHLVRKAVVEGIEVLDRTVLSGLDVRSSGVRLTGTREGRSIDLTADLIVDGSGVGGFLAGVLPLADRMNDVGLDTRLVFSHFQGIRPIEEVADAAMLVPGPYPDERAAVHHILDEGWMYVLPFDHGVVSAGVVFEPGALPPEAARLPADGLWRWFLDRYPTLGAQFREATATRPSALLPRLQRRLERAAGPQWALLPHAFAFWSPLFSTGIAWSLVAIERLADALEGVSRVPQAALQRYGDLLQTEADHLLEIVDGAYRCRRDFDLFAAYSYLYFAAASFGEASQRLLRQPPGGGAWCWAGFLGATDPVIQEMTRRSHDLVNAPPADARAAMRAIIAQRNVAGLADPARERMYPVDLECLVGQSELLGLSAVEIQAALPRLRGTPFTGVSSLLHE
jgi:FADH2 O2-dependent halogenase